MMQIIFSLSMEKQRKNEKKTCNSKLDNHLNMNSIFYSIYLKCSVGILKYSSEKFKVNNNQMRKDTEPCQFTKEAF